MTSGDVPEVPSPPREQSRLHHEGRPFSVEQATHILVSVADALDYLHEKAATS